MGEYLGNVYRPGGARPIRVHYVDHNLKYVEGYYDDIPELQSLPFEKAYDKHCYDCTRVNLLYKNFLNKNQSEEEKQMSDNTLYEITEGKNKGKFCTKLTRASSGLIVVETKGKDQDVFTVEEKNLKEVVPYSVCVSASGKATFYEVPEGSLSVGDVVFVSNSLGVVTEIGTNVKNPKNGEKIRVVQTKPLTD